MEVKEGESLMFIHRAFGQLLRHVQLVALCLLYFLPIFLSLSLPLFLSSTKRQQTSIRTLTDCKHSSPSTNCAL